MTKLTPSRINAQPVFTGRKPQGQEKSDELGKQHT